MAKTDYIQIRITPELKAELQRAAEADNRTMSSYVETLIKKALQDRTAAHQQS